MARSEGLPLLQDPTTPRTKARELALQQAATKRRRNLTICAVVVAALLAVAVLATTRGGHRGLLQPDATAALEHAEPFADVVDAYRARHDFDGVVQVRVNGSVVYELAGGLADEEFAVPMALDSVFPVGSNSKLFVAVALYQLQERALVNLSEPVNQYLDRDDFVNFGFPNQTRWCPRVRGAAPDSPCENITFVQLMHMGSGIGDSLNCDNVAPEFCHRTADNLAYYKGSLAPYIGIFINDPLVFKPDTNYSYANPNYYLLSYLVEKISGLRLEEYVKTMIADKIGLRDTYYDPYSGVLGVRRNYVQQYIHYYAQATPDADPATRTRLATGTCSPYMNSGAVSGSGGFRSTIADMQRWYTDLFDAQGAVSQVLTQASVRMLVERVNPVNPMYGQGIGVGKARASDGWPSRLVYCGGMKCCLTCLGMLFPEDRNETVVVGAFSNHMHYGFPDRAAFEVYHPTDVMGIDANATLTFADDGGAVGLRAALIDAYINQTTRAS